jgi:electron transport complex protein RnfE
MSAATFFVLFGSSLLVATFKKFIPNQVRISTYIVIIATFVTLTDMTLQAIVPNIHKELGAFIALIVVNCMILGRQEAFASKRPVGRALLDACGTGIGFTIALLILGTFREILGSGTVLGFPIFGPNFEPWVVFVLPPGGFLTIGFVLLALNAYQKRKEQRAAALSVSGVPQEEAA